MGETRGAKDFPRIPFLNLDSVLVPTARSRQLMNAQKSSQAVRRTDASPKRHRFPPGQILSLAYDLGLANSRELLLVSAGFHVSTFLDIDDAVKACRAQRFDLIVVGHSIPLAHRKAFVKELRRLSEAPVLAILRPGESPFVEADYSFDSAEDPASLLETVKKILRS
jgi:hypothetical protein